MRPCEPKRARQKAPKRRGLPGCWFSTLLSLSFGQRLGEAVQHDDALEHRRVVATAGCLLFTNNHSRQARASKQAVERERASERTSERTSQSAIPSSQRRSKRVKRQASRQAGRQACTGRPLARIYSGETSSKDQRGQVGRRREGPGLSRPRPSADTERGEMERGSRP